MKFFAWTLAGTIGLMGLIGCEPADEPAAPPPDPEPRQPAPDPGPPDEPAEPAPPDDEPLGIERDEDLAEMVRDQIEQEAQLDPEGRAITVSVEDGVVTLSGHVQSDDESQMIEQIAEDVAGPGNVQNELEVDPDGTAEPDDPQPLD